MHRRHASQAYPLRGCYPTSLTRISGAFLRTLAVY